MEVVCTSGLSVGCHSVITKSVVLEAGESVGQGFWLVSLVEK